MGEPAATGPAGHVDIDQIAQVWPAVLDQLLQTAPALAATFDGARPVEVDAEGRTVTIGFPADHIFNKRKAEAPDKREQMAAALESVLGERLRPAYPCWTGRRPRRRPRLRGTGSTTRRWWRRSRANSTPRRSVDG